MFKNVGSQKIAVFAWDTVAGAPKTGDAGNITAQISKDGGATAATDDVNPTELDAADAKGVYLFDMLQAETNADLVVLSPVSSTGNIVLEPVFVYTVTPMRGTDSAALASVLGAAVGASISADIAAVKAVADAIPTTAMRGTDSAALASVLGAAVGASISADIAAVKAVADGIPTTAMRGTDGAALASVLGAAVGASISADIAAIPTTMRGTDNAATAAGLAAHDGNLATVAALVAALNDLSAAQAEAACDVALASYDGPTKAEMDAAHALLATATALATNLVWVKKVLGAVAGKCFRNAAGTQLKFYDHAGALLSTLAWNAGTTTWDVTWA